MRWLAAALLLAAALPAQARELLVLTAAPVQSGKFHVLNEIGSRQGWHVRSVFADKLAGDEGKSLFAGADLVLLDIPYDPVVEAVERKVGAHLAAAAVPWLKVQSQRHAAKDLKEQDAKLLWQYYVNGGKKNFDHFFRYLEARVFAGSNETVPPPIVYPPQGIYHPDYEQGVFAGAHEYLAWKKVDLARKPPIVGIAIHQSYLASDLTAFIDHLVRRLEARGAVPIVFYAPMDDAQGFEKLLAPDGQTIADVLITSQIMLLPDLRKTEFERLGIPVIQAMPYRRGDVPDWEKDPAGVHLMDIPFYLAQPEYAGVTDAMTTAAVRKADGQIVPIETQVEAVARKALNLVRLQRTPNADKKVALFYWNYPPGETNLGASYLNVPKSLARLLKALHAGGYRVHTRTADELIPALQRLLRPYYRDNALGQLIGDGLADTLPVSKYRAWFERLPQEVRASVTARWGEPEKGSMVIKQGDQASFVIPRLNLGQLTLLPQPPRGEMRDDGEKALYHDTKSPANHYYLAVYLWARETFGAHALVHFGTHGTQEWMPGKERSPSVFDDSLLPIGDIPVVYPYIVDDVGEALQAKRRGRALIISHQTPPFAPAGLHNDLVDLHGLVHEWTSLTEGPVRDKTGERILAGAAKLNFHRDLGIGEAEAKQNFPDFLRKLHDWLHELALQAQPQGMHTLGVTKEARLRLGTVMHMLGRDFIALVDKGPDEAFVDDYRKTAQSAPFRFLESHVGKNEPLPANSDPKLVALIEKARTWYQALEAEPEVANLLRALDGRFIPTAYGGDPIRNPDSLPTGRNLYGFDPSRVPTRAAYEAGKEAVEKLIAAHRARHGSPPKKLAFTLWSVETMRHFGALEAQALYALGVRPMWDEGGRVTGVELIPGEELGRPRIDVVLSATGLYRDHFPNVMRWLAQGVVLASKADEPGNAVRSNTARLAQQLQNAGVDPARAESWATTRIFSNETGNYGSGINDAALASGTWDHESKLAELYLARMQYAYGADPKEWGARLPQVNLYAENLNGVEAAALSRTSNLYGMLTTDDPFQYLGGVTLAVRHVTGKSPDIYISNLRETTTAKAETAAEFLARELRTRQFHPGWIEGMKREGYSGTTEMLDSLNNFWGWQVTAPDIVRADQWQEFTDVYVRDKYKLGMRAWFEQYNPAAAAQMIERMLEAVRKEYWKADRATVRELATRYRDLVERFDVRTDNHRFLGFVNAAAGTAGYGLGRPNPSGATPSRRVARAVSEPLQAVTGLKLERVNPAASAPPSPLTFIVVLLCAATVLGAWQQHRKPVFNF